MKKNLISILIIIFGTFLILSPIFTVEAGKNAAKKKEKNLLNQYIEEGKSLFDEGNYQEALEKWTEALKIDPWNNEVKKLIDDALKKISNYSEELDIGFNYLKNNNLDKAKEIFNKLSKEIKPSDKKNYELLLKGIKVLEKKEKRKEFDNLLMKGDRYLDAGKIDQAEKVYKNAEKLFPEDKSLVARFKKIRGIRDEIKRKKEILTLKSKAKYLFEQEKLQESKVIWENVLKLKPNDEDAILFISKINFKEKEKEKILALGKSYFDTGVKLFKEKKYKEAMDQFENAIAVNYRVEDSQKFIDNINKAISEIEEKRNEERVEKVAKYLKEGIKLYNINKFREALKALNEGLTLDPENTQIKEYIVIVSIALKRQEEKKVPPISPFYPLIEDLKRLGKNAYRNGNYIDAIRYYEEILLIFPFNEYAKINLTKVLKKTDPKLVSEILNSMIKEAKELLQKGEKREAMEKIKTVLDVDPRHKEANLLYKKLKSELESTKKVITHEMINKSKVLYAKGVEYYKKEDLKDAIALWKKAILIYPNFIDARVSLAKAETKLRNLKMIESGKEQQQMERESLSITIKRHYIDGLNYYMNGLYKEAISEWEELLKLKPKDESFRETVRQNILRAEQRLKIRG